MILELNTAFEGFVPCEIIWEATSYREVYRAVSGEGKEVALTVYDMNALPECYSTGKIPEIDLAPLLTQDAFPEYVAGGSHEDGDVSLRWVARRYINGKTLGDCIREGRVFPEKETLERFYSILIAVNEISWRLKGGSHNNINTESILISENPDSKGKWYLTGLNCMSEPSQGKPGFDSDIPPYEYKSPEAAIGRFNQTTDIFSLGILLAVTIQGTHPWESLLNSVHGAYDYAKKLRNTKPEIDIQETLGKIIGKAISPQKSDRYRTLKDFGADIAGYLGKESISAFECFKPALSGTPAIQDSRTKYNKDDTKIKRQHDVQVQEADIRIEKISGEGFRCVAGMGELKSRLKRDFIDIVRNRELAGQYKITPPNGILLWGPPGTGKTYISRRLGEETGMLYSLVQPSDLGSIYIHGSQALIRSLFEQAEEKAKESGCGVLLVFDEFDSLVPKRGTGGDTNQANEVAEFLARLNGCADKGIYVIATTNRIEAIDPAITRKGRIDEMIYVGLPDEASRKELIELELSGRPHESIDAEEIARLTKGYTSSDISYIIRECARESFYESLKSNVLIKITQPGLEKTISATRSSVSAEELRQYERTRELYSRSGDSGRARIGFRI